jgi:hypothetical protein
MLATRTASALDLGVLHDLISSDLSSDDLKLRSQRPVIERVLVGSTVQLDCSS